MHEGKSGDGRQFMYSRVTQSGPRVGGDALKHGPASNVWR